MSKPIPKTPTGRILYLTDKFGVSQGYEPAFNKLVQSKGIGIPRRNIILASIHNLIDTPLVKYRNEKTLRFNPERKSEIKAQVDTRLRSIKPVLIVCSDPVSLGLFTGWDSRVSTLDKTRGGVYSYQGIPVVVTIPITAIHRNVDQRLLKDQDGEAVEYEPYRIPQGSWILQRDWEKIGRYYRGKQRKLPAFQYSICRTLTDLYAARDWLLRARLISVDIETALYPAQITCVGYTGLLPTGQTRSFVIPLYDETQDDGCFWPDEDSHAQALMVIREINESPILKVLQNGNYDSSYFVRDNLGLENFVLDSMLLWYALYMELPKSLDFIASILLDNFQYWKDDIKGADEKDEIQQFGLERYWRYNALDTYYTLFSCMYLLRLLLNNKSMQHNYNDVLMRSKSAFYMSMRGVRADFGRLTEHREKLHDEYNSAVDRFRYLIADPDFNVNSPDQKKSLLYDVLGARPRNAKGRFLRGDDSASSGAVALKAVKTDHPMFNYIIKALESSMEPAKQMSNITGWPDPNMPRGIRSGLKFFTDRMRTYYNAAGTETTRLSSKGSSFWDGGNVQNIRDSMRDFMVADEGCILLDVDYSQSDDVFMGYEANDSAKIAVIESGMDGHAVHGELFFKMPYDEIVAGKKAGDPRVVHPIYGVRQLSKKIVHGSNFNMSPPTLYHVLMGRDAMIASMKYLGFHDADKWSLDKLIQGGAMLMNAYRKKYPRFTDKGFYRELKEQLLLNGTLTNFSGTTRRFMGDPKDSGTIREAAAFIGQGGTAGNMNRVMYEIDHGYIPPRFRDGDNPDFGEPPRKMDLDSHGFRFLLQTHDSFTAQLQLDHPRFEEACHNLLHVMDRPVVINGHVVRVRTEASFGLRWGKKMVEWNPAKDSISDIVSLALAA